MDNDIYKNPDISEIDNPDSLGFDNVDIEGVNPTDSDINQVSLLSNGLTIVDDLTSINFTNSINKIQYLVFHYTAGSADNGYAAKSNANYFKSTYRGASAHYFVDRNPIIYRCVQDNKIAWHCGTTGTYYHSTCRNSNSIGIEMCSYKNSNGEYDIYPETIENAIWLGKQLIAKYNIPKDRVVMHWHVTHKVCPAPFITNNAPNSRWTNFVNRLYESDISITDTDLTGTVVNTNGIQLNMRSGPGTNYDITGKFNEGDIVYINGTTNNGWYRLTNNGYVFGEYVEIHTWATTYRDLLLEQGIITDKQQWSNYNEPITKGLAMQLISNIIGHTNANPTPTHWAENALLNLINKGIITDKQQWTDYDTYISKALFLALIDNITGGILEKYKYRNTDHWGRNHLDSLCDKGIINTPDSWINFDGQVTRDIAMALIYKSLDKIVK